MNDVVINKTQGLQRCIARVREEVALAGGDLASNVTHQDAGILNITRACELAIDLANYVIRLKKLGVPNDTRESFSRLVEHALVPAELGDRMKSMVGFRNVAVHDYRAMDPDILRWVVSEGLNDLLIFADTINNVVSSSKRK